MKKKFLLFNCIIAAAFILFVGFNLIKKDLEYSESENRYLADKPQISIESIKDRSFMNDAEDYSNDQLLLRELFIKIKANFERLIGKKENNGVYFAKDYYLIEKPAEINEELIAENINSIKVFSGIKRMNVSVCIIPQAFEILKDKLPERVYCDNISRLTETVNKSFSGTEVKNVDVTEKLSQNSGDYIFYRTDHHQTSFGSFLVYEALGEALGYTPLAESDFYVEKVSGEFFGTTYSKGLTGTKADEIYAYRTEANDMVTVEFYGENITGDSVYFPEHLDKKDKYSYFLDGNHGITVIRSNDNNGRQLAIFKDSYAHSLSPFLINHFESIHLIDMRYYNDDPLKYLVENEITDVLFLYGSSTFMTDETMGKIGYYSENSPYANFGLVKESSKVGNGYFDDAVFLGDSLMMGFRFYSGITEADYLCRTSLSVIGVFNPEEDGRSLIDKVSDTVPSKIYVMLGANELITMENKNDVMDKYSIVIDRLKQNNPGAIIYIHSIFPITEEKENDGRVKNYVIRNYNEGLIKLCEEKEVYYLDVQSAVVDERGYLPAELTPDGVHLGAEGCKIWVDYIKKHAIGGVPEALEAFGENEEGRKGNYDLENVAEKIKKTAVFESDIGYTDDKTLLIMHEIDESSVINVCGFAGGGAAAEEITLIEAASEDSAEIIIKQLSDYIEKRKDDFESYVPKEIPKLNSAVLFKEKNFVALIVASEINDTKEFLGIVAE